MGAPLRRPNDRPTGDSRRQRVRYARPGAVELHRLGEHIDRALRAALAEGADEDPQPRAAAPPACDDNQARGEHR